MRYVNDRAAMRARVTFLSHDMCMSSASAVCCVFYHWLFVLVRIYSFVFIFEVIKVKQRQQTIENKNVYAIHNCVVVNGARARATNVSLSHCNHMYHMCQGNDLRCVCVCRRTCCCLYRGMWMENNPIVDIVGSVCERAVHNDDGIQRWKEIAIKKIWKLCQLSNCQREPDGFTWHWQRR